jgi:hypothetical protein
MTGGSGWEGKEGLLFWKKEAKNSFDAGSWAASRTTPMAQKGQSFLLLFVHKKKNSYS